MRYRIEKTEENNILRFVIIGLPRDRNLTKIPIVEFSIRDKRLGGDFDRDIAIKGATLTGSRLARRIFNTWEFGVEPIEFLRLQPDMVTVKKKNQVDWNDILPEIRRILDSEKYRIGEHVDDRGGSSGSRLECVG
jgi:hypothetical protein